MELLPLDREAQEAFDGARERATTLGYERAQLHDILLGLLEAALNGEGHFIAWWAEGDDATAVRSHATDGSLIGEKRADGRFSAVPLSPESTTG